MGICKKKQLSEVEAAGQFVLTICRDVQQQWPQIVEDLKWVSVHALPKDQFAAYEFTLAVIAVQIQALPNLFPIQQATRLREYILRCISLSELGSYSRDIMQEYQNVWDESLQRLEIPLHGIAATLFDRLGCQRYMEFQGMTFKSPIFLMALSEKLTMPWPFCWKEVAEDYVLIP